MAKKIGQTNVDFGVSANAENAKWSLSTNPPKRRRNSDVGLLKVQNMKDINADMLKNVL